MKKRTNILIIALLLFSLLIFLNNNSPPLKFFSSVVQNIFSPIKSSLYGIKISIGRDDSDKVKKLKEENRALLEKLVEFERTKRDNEALRSQFETETTRLYKLMPAKIIGFLGGFTDPVVLITNKGESDGIKNGMVAIYENNFVGKIDRVSSSYSQIILPNNLDFSILGVTSEGSVPGIIKGQEDFILFDRVAINEKVAQGETVLTKGEINEKGQGIPPDLIVGRIASVNKNESQPYQSAKVEGVIPFSRLNIVFIVLEL